MLWPWSGKCLGGMFESQVPLFARAVRYELQMINPSLPPRPLLTAGRPFQGRRHFTTVALVCLTIGACSRPDRAATAPQEGRFASDLAFLQQYTTIVLLADP